MGSGSRKTTEPGKSPDGDERRRERVDHARKSFDRRCSSAVHNRSKRVKHRDVSRHASADMDRDCAAGLRRSARLRDRVRRAPIGSSRSTRSEGGICRERLSPHRISRSRRRASRRRRTTIVPWPSRDRRNLRKKLAGPHSGPLACRCRIGSLGHDAPALKWAIASPCVIRGVKVDQCPVRHVPKRRVEDTSLTIPDRFMARHRGEL